MYRSHYKKEENYIETYIYIILEYSYIDLVARYMVQLAREIFTPAIAIFFTNFFLRETMNCTKPNTALSQILCLSILFSRFDSACIDRLRYRLWTTAGMGGALFFFLFFCSCVKVFTTSILTHAG